MGRSAFPAREMHTPWRLCTGRVATSYDGRRASPGLPPTSTCPSTPCARRKAPHVTVAG